MNRLPSLIIVALCAFITVSCMKGDDVQPLTPVSLKQSYTAETFITGPIHMVTRGGGWEQDTTIIRQYLNRLIAAGKDPGFHKKDTTLSLDQQQELSFYEGKAQLFRDGEEKQYHYQLANNGAILWLTYTDTVTYYANQQPMAIDKLGLFIPRYYKEVLADDNPDYDYKISTVPEYYASVNQNMLYFPVISYHIKTKSGFEGSGKKENYLNEDVYQYLSTGDTLLIQGSVVHFK